MGEHFRCDRVQKFSVLGVREQPAALGRGLQLQWLSEAARYLRHPEESQAGRQLFTSPEVLLPGTQVTVTVTEDSSDPVFSVLEGATVIRKLHLSRIKEVSVADDDASHILFIADCEGDTESFAAELYTAQYVIVSLKLPSQKQAETLLKVLELLKELSSLGNLNNEYLRMSVGVFQEDIPADTTSTSSSGLYDPGTSMCADEPPNSPVNIYDPSTDISGLKCSAETSKLIEGGNAFVATLQQGIKQSRWPVKISEMIKSMAEFHHGVQYELVSSNVNSLMEFLKRNLKVISEHGICFDYVAVYGTRSPDLKVDIVNRLCTLRKFIDTNVERNSADKTDVLDVLNQTIRRITDRRILLELDQDKLNVLTCGEVLLQMNVSRIVKKKPEKVYLILTTEVLIITSPEFVYLTHVLTDKMTSATIYKESTNDFEVTLGAKVSDHKLHFRAKDNSSMKTWLDSLHRVMKRSLELYF